MKVSMRTNQYIITVKIILILSLLLASTEAKSGEMRTSMMRIRCELTLKNGKSLNELVVVQYILTGIKIHTNSSIHFPETGYGEINGDIVIRFSNKVRERIALLSGQNSEEVLPEIFVKNITSSDEIFKRNGNIILKFQNVTYESESLKLKAKHFALPFNQFTVSRDLAHDITSWMYRSKIEGKRTVNFLSDLDRRIKEEL
jgi:hypothetical protein